MGATAPTRQPRTKRVPIKVGIIGLGRAGHGMHCREL